MQRRFVILGAIFGTLGALPPAAVVRTNRDRGRKWPPLHRYQPPQPQSIGGSETFVPDCWPETLPVATPQA